MIQMIIILAIWLLLVTISMLSMRSNIDHHTERLSALSTRLSDMAHSLWSKPQCKDKDTGP